MHCFFDLHFEIYQRNETAENRDWRRESGRGRLHFLSEQSDDIEYRHDRHKHQKQNQTDSVYDILDLTVEGFTLNSFYNEEKQPSAVKRREGDEIENTETQREDYRNIDKVHETLSCNIGHDSDGADDAGYIALMDTVREHITDCFRGELYDVPDIAE